MRRRSLAILPALFFALAALQPAAAESFRQRLHNANEMLEAGNARGAMNHYQELMTEEPESPVLHYNMGLACYDEAMRLAEMGAAQQAVAGLERAQQAFQHAEQATPSRSLKTDAAFNHANSVAQRGKIAAEAAQSAQAVMPGMENMHDVAVIALEQAAKEYEDILERHPYHDGARQNLEHVRYLLTRLLQSPPPPPEQQQQQQPGDDEDEDEEQDEQEQQQQQGDEEGDEDEQDQQQPQDEEGEDGEQDQDRQQPMQDGPEQDEQQHDQHGQAQTQEMPEGNIEALLQSLEDVDEREQLEMKNQQHRGSPVQGDWW